MLLDTAGSSTVTVTSYANLIIADTIGMGAGWTVSGNLTVNGGFSLTTGANSLAVGGNAVLGGALNASGQTGAQTTTVGGSMSGAGSFTMANGTATPDADIDGAVSVATFTASAGQVNIGGNFTSPTFNAAGGTVVFDGAGDCDGKTFHNLTLSAGARTASGIWVVTNALTLSGGRWDPGTHTHQIGGNWNDTSIGFTPAGGTIRLTGANPSISQAAGNHFYSLTLDSGATLATAVVLADNLLISAGILDVTASDFQLTVGGNWTDNGSFAAHNGTVVFTGSGTVGAETFYNLVVNSAGTVSLAGAVTVSGDLSVSAGTLSTGANSLAVGGNAVLGGALNASGQTGAQTTTVGGSMSGAGSFTMANGTATPDADIDGAVSVATFTASAGQVNIGGNFTSPTFNAAGGTVLLDTAGAPR